MDGEVLLETYPTAQAAELDAAYLRTHGVAARVDGAMTGASSSGALTGMALGELVAIRLSVPEAQLDEARALMAELRKPDLRRPTFRVASDRHLLYAFVGGVGGAIAVAVIQQEWALIGATAGFVGGWLLGRKAVAYHCAASDCVGRFDQDAKKCPKCGRMIAGEIAHSSERLAAEEEWEQKRHTDPYRTDAETDDDHGDE